jgi:hypothetical protein
MLSKLARRVAGLLPAKIHGMPCLINPTYVCVVKGSYSYNAPSDWDYTGYAEVEFDVYDRKGYPAAWLQKLMTQRESEEIEFMILGATR